MGKIYSRCKSNRYKLAGICLLHRYNFYIWDNVFFKNPSLYNNLKLKTVTDEETNSPLLLSFNPVIFSFFDFRDRSILNPITRTQNPQRRFKTSLYCQLPSEPPSWPLLTGPFRLFFSGTPPPSRRLFHPTRQC